MTLDWRDTLKMLLSQFEARASKSLGLNHLLVEVADDERDKASGPCWFNPTSNNVSIVGGKFVYKTWDCCKFGGLPGISPGFREPRSDETFSDGAAPRVIRDNRGVVRAVEVTAKLRFGYFCGSPSEDAQAFESLANAAAAALAAANDLHTHAFGSDMTDIFRKPRGGVRYVFGQILDPPDHFVALGWNAGVITFENGVLIDVPIAESIPSASHWLLLLHRIGWRHIPGSGLRANRVAWRENHEVALEMLSMDWAGYPTEFSEQFTKISKDSFYSVLGTKDAPLDVNLASAMAIQVLLADLSSNSEAVLPGNRLTTDYSREEWKVCCPPIVRTVERAQVRSTSEPRIGILVATEVERQAVLKKMQPAVDENAVLQLYSERNTFFLGRLGITNIVLCMGAMGSLGRDASTLVTADLISEWDLKGIIMVGIAFGKDSTKQDIGTVLVSDRIVYYEPQRIGHASNQDRGAQPSAGMVLLDRFRNVLGWDFRRPDGRQCGIQFGPLLSGEKLVDNVEFKKELFDRYPTAIGGEMEGAGVAAAAARHNREWIVVKAICDWGDGSKQSLHQEFAAASAVHLVEHVLNQPGALDSLVK